MNVIGADELEFRSDDWYYFSQDNMVDGNTIQRGWDYGEAKSTPPAVGDMLCGM